MLFRSINATNDVGGNLTSAFTNRLTYTAQGSTLTGSTNSPNFTLVNSTSAATFSFSRTATFANADAVRYFFNAGGQLNFVVSSVTNGDGTNRSGSLATLAATNFASKKIGAQDAVARTGSGGTVNADLTTNYGYYVQTTANLTMSNITGTSTSYKIGRAHV